MWSNWMHAEVCPACGYRSNREDLSSGMAYGASPWARRAFPVSRRTVGGLSPRWYVWVQVHGVVWCKYHLEEFRVVVVYVILNKNKFVRINLYHSSRTIT